MNLTFTWINILILIGAFNALVFCMVLLFQRQHAGAKYLAAFVFVFAYNGFETFNLLFIRVLSFKIQSSL